MLPFRMNAREASILITIAGGQMYVEGPRPVRPPGTYIMETEQPEIIGAFIKRLRMKDSRCMRYDLIEESEALAKRLDDRLRFLEKERK